MENYMVKEVYQKALQNGYAIGAFNFSSLEVLKAIIQACDECDAPVIASVSEGALKYLGKDYLQAIIKVAKSSNNRVMFHLDHGKSFDICKEAIALGFDSVMIDASSMQFEENVALTKKVCTFAHKKGIFVEGELGVLAGVEDNVSAEKSIYTNASQAEEFAKRTQVDSLAVAIGTSHGAYKFSGEPKLNLERLKEIQDKLPNLPLVLHGASSVYEEYTQKFNQFGGELKNAKGVPDEILHEVCTNYHICKINTDTDLRICFLSSLKQSMSENPSEIDPRKHFAFAVNETKKLIIRKIHVFGL